VLHAVLPEALLQTEEVVGGASAALSEMQRGELDVR